MKLGHKQELFSRLWMLKLVPKAYELGFQIRGGDLFRDPRAHGEYGEKEGYSSTLSNHKLKLAVDLNITKDGVFQTTTEDHAELGEYWISLHELCRWGGSGGNNDGNHYSLEHNGRW